VGDLREDKNTYNDEEKRQSIVQENRVIKEFVCFDEYAAVTTTGIMKVITRYPQ
jgi:hypothetical protein